MGFPVVTVIEEVYRVEIGSIRRPSFRIEFGLRLLRGSETVPRWITDRMRPAARHEGIRRKRHVGDAPIAHGLHSRTRGNGNGGNSANTSSTVRGSSGL